MKNQAISIILLGFFFIPTCTQTKKEIDKYEGKVWQSPQGGTLRYCFRAPEKVEREKKYPLLFFLHGAGGSMMTLPWLETVAAEGTSTKLKEPS
ncbi:MAG TPA: hypothetical protein EYO04_01820, partial [Candidatus Marinimicrobia bacterium]|nr:hypothetical protein [Candidatus Neomarinimicrobiota bacterium]